MVGISVEAERRRRGMSQTVLSSKAGISTAWLRQLECGHPNVKLEAHFSCVEALGLTPMAVLLPTLFAAQRVPLPPQLLQSNLTALGPILVETVISWHVGELRKFLTRDDLS
ncbi:helix-turn-helix domain-containing protein [Sphingobium chungbukense]|uniref:HTH cro/C1-type domain-containing protein n=1 Tax=Sphingobium chungbukense TaxID=56193 RepID=A0A0M3AMK4_9SPHN|nr:helix-turn-helix domain-containing protein [Sphingobium chungbukense]KKW90171.1 hypothetical protein YP76_22330 [Sphingobium chungbukense]